MCTILVTRDRLLATMPLTARSLDRSGSLQPPDGRAMARVPKCRRRLVAPSCWTRTRATPDSLLPVALLLVIRLTRHDSDFEQIYVAGRIASALRYDSATSHRSNTWVKRKEHSARASFCWHHADEI